MFHTFETAQYGSPGQQDAHATAAAKRRTSTVRACEPCRRRKIRCNGEHPCETCQWYRKAASCHYTEPRQRQVPSRRSIEKISQALEVYRGILQKLFPKAHYEQLAGLSRDELIDLIAKTSTQQAPSPLSSDNDDKHNLYLDVGSLEQLQPLPEEPEDVFARPCSQRTNTGISDDIHSLSLAGKESSSYLGISSVMAALRVILWLDPDSQSFITRATEQHTYLASPSSPFSMPDHPPSTTPTGSPKPSPFEESCLIDAYFTYIHPSTPLIDENTFRQTYDNSSRSDHRWLLLLNTVLAVGSTAASTNLVSANHAHYFALARPHLTIDTLNSAHIETAQALALLSGIYLHYIGEPNLANTLMGATLRMATALGLHRDFSEGLGPAKKAAQDAPHASFSIEMRSRVWWSTFMLDTWVGSTLGRPSMGRMSQAITAKHPKEAIGGSDAHLRLVRENIKFALISTKIEDSLAVSPLMDEIERQSLDNALAHWYQSSTVKRKPSLASAAEYSPSSAHSHSQAEGGPGMNMTMNVMRWRYHLTRVILHRPSLLWWAMRSRKFSSSALSPQKRTAIDLCQSVTADLISDITSTWQSPSSPACAMSAWHASGVLYQAVMVPLLALFCDANDATVLRNSGHQVEATIAALIDMSHWCKTAKHSLEVVSRLYEASRRHSPQHGLKQEQDDEHNMLGHEPYSASSASASVSGGMGSGGLGTPATLPSTISNSSQHHHLSSFQQPTHPRPTFIDIPPLSSHQPFTHPQPHTTQTLLSQGPGQAYPQNAQGAPFLATPSSGSADMFMDTMLDSLNWSQGWNNNEYPFETPRLGWDFQAMNGWVGGVGGGGMVGGEYEYFGGPAQQQQQQQQQTQHPPGQSGGARGSVSTTGTGPGSVSEDDGGAGRMHGVGGVDMRGFYH